MGFSDRTELIAGKNGVDKLKNSKVLVCGIGGVGGYALESLARAGVGVIGILDNDVLSESNINRQILATVETVGKLKTEVAKKRVLSINPDCKVEVYNMFYLPGNADAIDVAKYDYILDAMDTVTAKIEIITRANAFNVPIISCMGTGNKFFTSFEIADISDTSVCPLAKVMRKELKSRGIVSLKTVYSKEQPVATDKTIEENGRHLPGSISYVPPVAGFTMAGEVIRYLLHVDRVKR